MSVRINKYNIHPFVKFLGFREDINYLMSISDIFVHSTLTEAFGLVLIEAMAMGLPIVSTKVEAIPEFVSQPDNYLVDIDDYKNFQKSVKEILIRKENLRFEVSQRNKNFARSIKFSRSQRAENMYQLFFQILKK